MNIPEFLVHPRNGSIFVGTRPLVIRGDLIPADTRDEAEKIAAQHGATPPPLIQHPIPNKPQNSVAPDTPSDDSPSDVTPDDDDTFVISTATKDELEAFAREAYDVELDKRKKVATLRDEVRTLAEQ